jgi:hypothetical protein
MNLAHAAVKIQRTLDALPSWLDRWRLRVNVAKTQAIALSTKHNQPPELRLLGQPLPWQRTVKYLGVTIDRRLNMSAHVNDTISRTRTARALLTPVMKSSLPLTAKIEIEIEIEIFIDKIIKFYMSLWLTRVSYIIVFIVYIDLS